MYFPFFFIHFTEKSEDIFSGHLTLSPYTYRYKPHHRPDDQYEEVLPIDHFKTHAEYESYLNENNITNVENRYTQDVTRYSNPIGASLFEFLDADLSNTRFIKKSATKYGVIALHSDVNDIHFELDDYDEINTDTTDQITFEHLMKTYSDLILEDYQILQKDLKKILHYVYNIDDVEYLKNLTPSQRYYIYLHTCITLEERNRIESYLKNIEIAHKFDFSNLTSNITSFKDSKDLARQIKKIDKRNQNYNIVSFLYSFSSLITYYYFCVLHFIENNIPIKECKNCGRFFIPENRISSIYCNRIFENNKTCKEIGATISYNEKLKKDEVNMLYRKTLSAKKMLANRNPDIPMYLEKYEKWKNEANQFKKEIKQGNKTEDEFRIWIEETRKYF